MRVNETSVIQTGKALDEGRIVSFKTQEEMVTEVAVLLALDYKSGLEFWQATAMDDPEEREMWIRKQETEIEPYYQGVRAELERQVKACEKLPFFRKHLVRISSKKYPAVIAAGLAALGSDNKPYNIFAVNVLIIIDVRKNRVQKRYFSN